MIEWLHQGWSQDFFIKGGCMTMAMKAEVMPNSNLVIILSLSAS